jgi:hypothetical protein
MPSYHIINKGKIYVLITAKIVGEISMQGGKEWYHIGSCQTTVGLVVSEIGRNIFLCTKSHF